QVQIQLKFALRCWDPRLGHSGNGQLAHGYHTSTLANVGLLGDEPYLYSTPPHPVKEKPLLFTVAQSMTRVPLPWGLPAHPPYRCLHLSLKGAVAGEALADIVQQGGSFLGFAEESQQFSTCHQEQGGFVIAPAVLIAHDGVDPSLRDVQTPGQHVC